MRIRAEVELGAWQRGCSWDWGRLRAVGGAWDLHAQGGFEEGLVLGVFVIYCPPPRDPAPFLLLQIFFSPSSSFFFKCFDSSYHQLWSQEKGGEWRAWKGATPPLATGGVYMSAADVERERERLKGWAGKLLVFIPAFSLSFS